MIAACSCRIVIKWDKNKGDPLFGILFNSALLNARDLIITEKHRVAIYSPPALEAPRSFKVGGQ